MDETIPTIEEVESEKKEHLEIPHDVPQSHTKPKGVLF